MEIITQRKMGASVLFVVLFMLISHTVYSDCGSVPFYAPLEGSVELIRNTAIPERIAEVKFDPLEVSVFEPMQRAIILWNGKEEILLLSTDQRASRETAVLEVIPLPARPEVRLGDFSTFEAAQRLMVEKRTWATAHGGARAQLRQNFGQVGGRVEFSRAMGAHDLTVAEVLNRDNFVSFVQDFLQQKYGAPQASIKPEFVQIIDSYLVQDYSWFAFDVIRLSAEENHSREPIEYRFASEEVYYPMNISTAEKGQTRVNLLVFTPTAASESLGMEMDAYAEFQPIPVQRQKVEQLDKEWKDFFGPVGTLSMQQWIIEGDIGQFQEDVRLR